MFADLLVNGAQQMRPMKLIQRLAATVSQARVSARVPTGDWTLDRLGGDFNTGSKQ